MASSCPMIFFVRVLLGLCAGDNYLSDYGGVGWSGAGSQSSAGPWPGVVPLPCDCGQFCAHPVSKAVGFGSNAHGTKSPILGRKINTMANRLTPYRMAWRQLIRVRSVVQVHPGPPQFIAPLQDRTHEKTL